MRVDLQWESNNRGSCCLWKSKNLYKYIKNCLFGPFWIDWNKKNCSRNHNSWNTSNTSLGKIQKEKIRSRLLLQVLRYMVYVCLLKWNSINHGAVSFWWAFNFTEIKGTMKKCLSQAGLEPAAYQTWYWRLRRHGYWGLIRNVWLSSNAVSLCSKFGKAELYSDR